MKRTLTRIAIMLICAMSLTVNITEAQAQSASDKANSQKEANATGFQLRDLLAQARQQRRSLFSLMPESRAANISGPAFNITPMAAGPNLPVMGSGTLGCDTKSREWLL